MIGAIKWPAWKIDREIQAIRGVLFWIKAAYKLTFVWGVDTRGMSHDDIKTVLRDYDPSAWHEFINRRDAFRAKWAEFYKEVK